MSRSSPRVFSREFKLQVVGRMLAGENVSALSRELKIPRNDLYVWRDRFESGGPEALRGRGRPRKGEAVASAASGKIG
jgi:transposase